MNDLDEDITCAKCGAAYEDGGTNCPECGSNIKRAPTGCTFKMMGSVPDVESSVIRPYAELFEDAEYFKGLATTGNGLSDEEIRRYYRMALISYCMAAEAGINQMLAMDLKEPSPDSRVKPEEFEELRGYLKYPNKKWPSMYGNIIHRLYNWLVQF